MASLRTLLVMHFYGLNRKKYYYRYHIFDEDGLG